MGTYGESERAGDFLAGNRLSRHGKIVIFSYRGFADKCAVGIESNTLGKFAAFCKLVSYIVAVERGSIARNARLVDVLSTDICRFKLLCTVRNAEVYYFGRRSTLVVKHDVYNKFSDG